MVPPSTGLPFPNEIFDNILIKLCDVPNELPSPLIPCSLVCRKWNTLCQRHIFTSKWLTNGNIEGHMYFALMEAPHLPQYVQTLSIDCRDLLQRPLPDVFPSCFLLFEHIQTLHLGGLMGLSTFSPPLYNGILMLASVRNLQRLDISAWELNRDNSSYLTGVLQACARTLLHLCFNFCVVDNPDGTEWGETVEMCALQTLKITTDYEGYFIDQPIITCPNLQEYIMDMYEARNVPVCGIFPTFVNFNLPHFTMKSFPQRTVPYFNRAIHISWLTLNIETWGSLLELFAWLESLLYALPLSESIERITLNIDVNSEWPLRDGVLITSSNFQPLAYPLAKLFKFGKLKVVEIDYGIVVRRMAAMAGNPMSIPSIRASMGLTYTSSELLQALPLSIIHETE